MQINLEIDESEVICKVLLEDLDLLDEQIKHLESLEHLRDYQERDLAESKRFHEALEGVLEYYGCT